jgi:CubicO group peptidase (beta-lactamase class C family)
MRRRILAAACSLAAVAGFSDPASAQTAPAHYLPDGEVPAALQELRRHVLDANVNSLTFRSMDQLFDTRVVGRAGPVQALGRAETSLPDYQYKGHSYTTEQFEARTFTNALLVMREGRILHESYRNNSSAETHFASFSMAKSITAMLVGVAVDKGLIKSLDEKVTLYVPELKGSGYENVSLRQLLQMRSGVDYTERYDFGDNPSPAAQVFEQTLVQSRRRFADLAPSLKSKTRPGSTFNYSTMDTAVLGWALERVVKQPIAAFMSQNLWEPAGMESYGYWLMDGPPGVGREMNGMGFNATLRDFARLGQLMLDEGVVGGKQLLSKEWVRLSTTMIPIETGANRAREGYGFQWWQLDDSGAYAALGLQGQFIYVHPASRTVIVKLSFFPPGDSSDAQSESVAFFQAVIRTKISH